jgi:PD-(D/E)XK endonuclease
MTQQWDDPNTSLNDAAHRNSKRTGELSEAAFLHKAVELGFRVTKPWGDSERYDFVLDSGRRLWRVQIKCTAVERAGGYHIQPIHFVYGKNKVVYTAEDIDVLAAHIVPLDVWYVVPVAALAQGRSLRLYPDDGCKTARFEKYREGWDFFRGGEGRGGKEQMAATGTEAGATVGDEDPGDESIPLCFTRLAFVWKPRFFGR